MKFPKALVSAVLAIGVFSASAQAQDAAQALKEAQALYREGQYFRAARYAFAAKEADPSLAAEADSWIALGLSKARLFNSASYYFIKALESNQPSAVRRVLGETQELLTYLGPDVLRKYLIRHTKYEDYDSINRSAYLYALAKEALLSGNEEKAIGYVGGMSSKSTLWPFGLQLRASAEAILGRNERALADFRECADRADQSIPASAKTTPRGKQLISEAQDLEARCRAGEGRTLYQMERFEEADQAYDQIPKSSIVWPDMLFEQAWNAFARNEYNRSLGKLVSYKSPALTFVFNPEVDVLRAQSYLALCLYSDANEAINGFNARYANVGEQVKRFVEANSPNLDAFYEVGKKAVQASIYTNNDVYRMANRFVRSPYFQGLVKTEESIEAERLAIQRFSAMGGRQNQGQGFPGFLNQVLRWRQVSVRLLGGAFVKNSFLDHHAELLANFDKMSFIKLEMLKRAKEKLLKTAPKAEGDRSWGNVEPARRDYQYYWTFNGEFWNDELGDYVFGLESECGGNGQ